MKRAAAEATNEQSQLEDVQVAKTIARFTSDAKPGEGIVPSQVQLKTIGSPLFCFLRDALFSQDTDEESQKFAVKLLYKSLRSEHTLKVMKIPQIVALQGMIRSIKDLGSAKQIEIGEPLHFDALNYLLDNELLKIGTGLHVKFQELTHNNIAVLQQINALVMKSNKCTSVQITNATLDFASAASPVALFTNVTRLTLVNVMFTPQAVLCLTSYLNTTPILASLSVVYSRDNSYNASGDALGTNLALSLCYNTSLKQLTFSGSGEYWPLRFAQALTMNSTLQTLDLHDNHISFLSLDALLHALESNKGLTYLCLSHCAVSAGYSLIKLGKALAGNKTLKALNLSENKLNGKSVKGLLSILSANASLKALDISSNPDLATDDQNGSLRTALLTAKLDSLSIDESAFVNADEDKYILQFLLNRTMSHLALVQSDSHCHEPSILEVLADKRNFNLMMLSTKFQSAGSSCNYNFDSTERKRLYYFEQILLSRMQDDATIDRLYNYNRFLSSPALMEILFCAHNINHEGVKIGSELIGKITEYLNEIQVSIYQKCMESHYRQIKQRDFRDAL